MDSTRIGEKMIKLRGEKSRGMVATDLGISLSAVAMYETGARIPRDELKKKIADYYGVSVEYLFFS